MSWGGGGGGNYNPNAQSWTPPGQQQNQQGGYNQNQQQGGWGGQQPQQGGYQQGGYQNQGGYQQQQGGYQNQQGGYNQGYNQQGGYNQGYNQQGGYNGQGYNQQQGGYQNQGGYHNQQQAGVPAPASQQAPAPAPAPVVEPVQPVKSAADKNKLKLDLGGGNKKKKNNDFVMPKKGGGGGFSLSAPGGNVIEKPEEKKADAEASTEEKKPEEKKVSKGFSLGGAKEEEKKVEEAPVESPKVESPAGSPTTETEATTEPKGEEEKPEATEEKKVEKSVKDQKKMRVQKEYKRDPRPHHNVVFCGHVDAGKSTISGHILSDVGVVDDREMAKLKREAETNHREGWEFAYCMDVSEEERAKGKTHETGAAYFETEKKRITILDAPGHKAFVPSMIGGAAQADVCVLVISARTGEFETGFENGGQSREHAMLVRACGVKHMVLAINKMDDQNWEIERYNEIKSKLEPFLRQNGYAEKAKNLSFMPISGLSGEGLVHPVTKAKWYKGPSLVQYLNDLVLEEKRSEDDDLVMPVAGAYKDEGKIYIYGKIESGSICVGDRLTILPLKNELIVEGIQIEGATIDKAYPSDNCHLIVRGVDESQVHAGYVIVMEPTPLKAVDYFQARIIVLEVKNLLSNGSRMMMNLGVAEQEVSIHKILGKLDPKSQEIKVIEKEPTHVRGRESFMARLELSQSMVVEDHKKFDKLGRFMLREEGRTVAIGLITKLYESTKEQVDNGTAPKQK